MSRYSDAPDHIKAEARTAAVGDPPLNDIQKTIIRASFGDSGLGRPTT